MKGHCSLTLLCFLVCTVLAEDSFSQGFNNNPKAGFIGNEYTKTPESASLGRYGEIPISEFTGTTNVSIPLYEVKSGSLSLPVSLGYHASGVKVNQESTWVGLGWELLTGGRISIAYVGGVDGDGEIGWDEDDAEVLLNSVQNMFGGDFCYYRGSTACISNWGTSEVSGCMNDTWRDNRNLILDINRVGALQPDVYTVSFKDQNFSFYRHPVSGLFKYKGEKKKFLIASTANGWRITDDHGVEYYFEKQELTHFYPYLTPPHAGNGVATTSWLLTKIKNSAGNEILLSYTSYGEIYPTPIPIKSVTVYPYDNNQNVSVSPLYQQNRIDVQYLSSIETNAMRLNFQVGSRLDLNGAGARKLNQIIVTDKLNNRVVKTITFKQSYFQTAATTVERRLKLDRLIQDSVTNELQQYSFEYELTALPAKTSTSQDHWGFYNGKPNGDEMCPSISSLVSQGILSSSQVCNVLSTGGGVTSPGCRNFPMDFTANREPNTSLMKAGMLKKIVYPTRGYTEFTYEAHVSYYNFNASFTGGGLRTKLVESFDELSNKISSTEYRYLNAQGKSSGSYMGKIQYHKVTNVLSVDYILGTYQPVHIGTYGLWNYYSDGIVNDLGYSVAYNEVTRIDWNKDKSKTNGKTVKYFSLLASQDCFGTSIQVPLPRVAAVPSPNNGWLMQEKFYDDANGLVKEKRYHYQLLDFDALITHVQAEDNSYVPESLADAIYPNFVPHPNWARIMLYFIPTKSYATVQDSVTEILHTPGQILKSVQFTNYNEDYQVSQQGEFTSDNRTKLTKYHYPKYRVNQGATNPYSQMVTKNILSSVVEEQYFIDTELLSKNITDYREWYPGVILPEFVRYQYKNNSPETVTRYLNYSSKGDVLCAQQENGMPVTYLWGYKGLYPIAMIQNATYNEVVSVMGSTIGQLYDDTMGDEQLRFILHNYLRVSMPNALVTTYTFAPLIGMTSQTDSNNQTTFYEYDGFNRLKLIKDPSGNILKRFTYHFKK